MVDANAAFGTVLERWNGEDNWWWACDIGNLKYLKVRHLFVDDDGTMRFHSVFDKSGWLTATDVRKVVDASEVRKNRTNAVKTAVIKRLNRLLEAANAKYKVVYGSTHLCRSDLLFHSAVPL